MANAYNIPTQNTAGIFIGSSFADLVRKQLDIRKQKLAGTQNNYFSERTNEEVLYLNARTSWVRLSSAIDVNDDKGETAKNNVLQGGVVKFDNSVLLRGGLGTTDEFAYKNGEELGFRPMAGIESVSIKYKSRFGTLRDAEVRFRCNNLEQLNTMETLYMRPGYSVLLEWGHSTYYDNDSKFQTNPTTLSLFEAGLNKEKLYDKIVEQRRTTGGNYDAMYGFIRNFSWTFREDGGYDCISNIVAIGDVLDSLKINATGQVLDILGEKTDNSKKSTGNLSDDKTQSNLHAILYKINKIISDYNNSSIDLAQTNAKQYFESSLSSDPTLTRGYCVKFSGTDTGKFCYISLGMLCSILNQSILLKNGASVPLVRINIDTEYTRCLCHEDQISIDPGVCLIPGDPKSKISNAKINSFIADIAYRDYDAPFNGKAGKIYRILINIDYIAKVLYNVTNSNDQREVSLQALIQELLKGVGVALGNINSFSFSYDSEFNEAIIVDEQRIPGINFDSTNKNPSTSLYEIPIFGLSSLVTHCHLHAEIFPEMSTMISIAAQNGGQSMGIDGTTLSLFNENLVDRIMSDRTYITSLSPSTNASLRALSNTNQPGILFTGTQNINGNSNQQDYNAFISKLQEHVENLNKPIYSASECQAISNLYRDYLVFIKHLDSSYRSSTLIPIKLNITMFGVSGMRIGQAFTLPDNRLPENYKGRVCFFITGLSHSIQGNIWTTEIVSQMMMNGVSDSGGKAADNLRKNLKDNFTPTNTGGSSTENIATLHNIPKR